jgi:hypothetical protein
MFPARNSSPKSDAHNQLTFVTPDSLKIKSPFRISHISIMVSSRPVITKRPSVAIQEVFKIGKLHTSLPFSS